MSRLLHTNAKNALYRVLQPRDLMQTVMKKFGSKSFCFVE
ncbi:hypothetical protein TcasGA2_TC032260 [Tribolium castaneum]|uniref:Uncharacterized protein n=1 Tax=Tribolium castaneum TaxID=7070 RepID=A0A139WLS3_TRICA|nr:hypothetical protein TcasGA2_TC032260 [Tribolium castaneum]